MFAQCFGTRAIEEGCESRTMKTYLKDRYNSGAMGWAMLWLLGVPIPILLILFLVRGCT